MKRVTRCLLVGGTFDENGGSPSGVVKKLAEGLRSVNNALYNWDYVNGGSLDRLTMGTDPGMYDVCIWMPNVDNKHRKLLPDIKKLHPTLTLVGTKNTIGRDFSDWDMVGRLLKAHCNLGIMISKDPDGKYRFKLTDPLGNVFEDTTNIYQLAGTINARLYEMLHWTRLRSTCLGARREIEVDPEFLTFVQDSAEKLTQHVNAINPNRFLGNASTRCSYGFPAVRGEIDRDRIFVTRRNIDKQYVDSSNFVEVTNAEDKVEYFGEHKPSVDTPIQVKLFNHYPRINYMIHGHSYLHQVPMTENVIPCGAVEEFDDISELFSDRLVYDFACNLRGHGFIIGASTVSRLGKYDNLKSRPFPEIHVPRKLI